MDVQQLIVGIAEAAKRLDVTKKTIYAFHSDDPTFPRIFKLSPRKSAILEHELDEWILARRANHRIDGQVEGGAQ